jgi:hypothetical protein
MFSGEGKARKVKLRLGEQKIALRNKNQNKKVLACDLVL